MFPKKKQGIVYVGHLDTYGIVKEKDGDFLRVDMKVSSTDSQIIPVHKTSF